MIKPIAYARRWYVDNEPLTKVRNPGTGRMGLPFRFKLHPVTAGFCLKDDVALYPIGTLDWKSPTEPPPFLPRDTYGYEQISECVLLCTGKERSLRMGYYQQNLEIEEELVPDGDPKWITSCSERWTLEDVVGWAYVTGPTLD